MWPTCKLATYTNIKKKKNNLLTYSVEDNIVYAKNVGSLKYSAIQNRLVVYPHGIAYNR
jgi:hypothetical protein